MQFCMTKKIILLFFFIALCFNAFCKIWTVTNSGTSFSPDQLTINLGDTVQFSIAASHDVLEVNKSTWDSNGNAALVGGFSTPFGGGMVKPNLLALGTHYYVCTPHAAFGMKAKIIVQTPPTTQANLQWSNPSDIVYGTLLSAAQLSATANVAGTFRYTPALGAKLTAGANQTLSVNFQPNDVLSFAPSSMSVHINVAKADPDFVWPAPADIIYGTALSLDQYVSKVPYLGVFDYNPPVGTVLEPGTETISLTFKPTDFNNYNNVSKSTTINIKKKTPVINWSQPLDMVYNDVLSTFQLNASANTPGAMLYNPPLNTAMLAGDNQTLSVQFTPNDQAHYVAVSKSVVINVKKDMPLLTWIDPHPIVYGQPLSSLELNGIASVDGTITFDPPLGTVVDAGESQTLSMHFVPKDQANYQSRSYSVHIKVAQADQTVSFAPSTPLTYASTEQLNAQGFGSFTYTIQSGAASIVSSNQLKANSGTGSCVVRASTVGDKNHKAAFADATVNFQKAAQTITFDAISDKKTKDAAFLLHASSSSGLPVVFTNKNAQVVSLDASTVTILAVGTATVEANQAGDDNYLAAPSVVRSFVVSLSPATPVSEVSIDKIKIYPNPFDEFISVKLPNDVKCTVVLFDASGRKIREISLSQAETLINVGDLQTGLYILQTSIDGIRTNLKIAKR